MGTSEFIAGRAEVRVAWELHVGTPEVGAVPWDLAPDLWV